MDLDVSQTYQNVLEFCGVPQDSTEIPDIEDKVKEKMVHNMIVFVDSFNISSEELRCFVGETLIQLNLFAYVNSHLSDISPITDLTEYMEATLSAPYTLQDIANLVGVPLEHLQQDI